MRTLLLTIALSLAGCATASTPHTQPNEMSAAGHEAAAIDHEQVARAQLTEYRMSGGTTRCTPTAHDERGDACWSAERDHLEAAEKNRKMAAEHRAASQALRNAEALMCVGLSDADRDTSPFDHREDIAGVEPLNVRVGSNARTVGAVITFRAVPGMTAQYLQRLIDCHIARNAALGNIVPEMPSCPLVPKGVSAKVTGTEGGFAVSVQSDDSATAQEILRRAQSLGR